MQRHHLNPPNIMDTIGIGFLSSSKNVVIWEPTKAEQSETYFQYDQVDTANIFIDFKMHQQKNTHINYYKFSDVAQVMGGFFIALQSGAIFLYYVVLSGIIKKQMAKEASDHVANRVTGNIEEVNFSCDAIQALYKERKRLSQDLNFEAQNKDIPEDLREEYFLREIDSFRSINYTFELERKIEIL